ncbi:MCE family protein [Gordonia jinghuaiqii]|uniref:MCE family protein n=1 Tax=Gordonia jinghuaiqii TaxID=2758710 RepID=A0A7D7LXB9_9ACTN|nr:MlaD family protein [Gordonia jinghuaiqii]MCR5979246.1 MCE family protein [Gordonia jinghuaiqii]QMT01036.1 MCE family protein [Gordonia jinghuaiqii]
MNIRNLVSVLGMLTIAALALVYMGSMGLSVTDNVGVRTASVQLPHSNNLVVGSRVLLRGEPIGKVTEVTAGVDGVTVEWNYKDSYELPAAVDLRIDNLSALGESYIAVTPRPGGGRLPEGQVLSGRSVVVPTTIDEFSARFTRLLEQVNADRVNTIIEATNQGLPANQKILDNFVRAGSLLQSTVLTTRSSFERLLTNMQPLLAQAEQSAPDIGASGGPLADFGKAMGGFVNTGPWVTQAVNLPSGNDLLPYGLDIGVGPFLEDVLAFLTKASPDIKILADAVQPSVSSAARQLGSVDLSQLMKAAMSASGDGDGIVVRIGEK